MNSESRSENMPLRISRKLAYQKSTANGGSATDEEGDPFCELD